MSDQNSLINEIKAVLEISKSWVAPELPEPSPTLHIFQQFQLWLHQACDTCGLQKTTKFLAKTYFQLTMTAISCADEESAKPYLLSSLLLAMKINENMCNSENCHLISDLLFNISTMQISKSRNIQLQIFELLDQRLHFSSPYDYAQLYLKRTRSDQKTRKKLQLIIDFAITQSAFNFKQPKHIFLACLLKIEQKKIGERDKEALREYCGQNQWVMICKIETEIEAKLQQFNRQQKTSTKVN